LDYSKTDAKLRLSRDILIYLVNKHDAYLPVTSIRDGNSVWKSVAEEYNRMSKGLFTYKDPNQLNGKWRNILYHARKFGYPHPLESQGGTQQQESELIGRIQEFTSSPRKVEFEDMPERNSRLTEFPVQNIKKIVASDSRQIHANNSIKRQQRNTKIRTKTCVNSKTKKQRYLVALEFDQEKLRLLKETHEIEKNKLLVELETAKVQLQKEKLQLLVCKNEARIQGILT
jgi:hypothetical protein